MSSLTIQVDTCFELSDLKLEIQAYLGNREDVYYFKTLIYQQEQTNIGLLRVGSSTGGLHRELLLRDFLKEHKMISPLINISREIDPKIVIPIEPIDDSQYLEEEYYPEEDIFTRLSEKIILLSQYPQETLELEDLASSLISITQICQFFRHVSQNSWCFVSLLPEYITKGPLVCFYDLTCAYPLNSPVTLSNLDRYCVRELIYKHPVQEQDSSYVVGKLIAKIFAIDDSELLNLDSLTLEQKKVPLLWQIISLSLYPIAQNRPSLTQLLSLLVALRRNLLAQKIDWEIASDSIVGLSQYRLENEDNYLIRQQKSNNGSIILAAVADGMGGLNKGEIASSSAIEALSLANLPSESENIPEYLNNLINQANLSVRTKARDSGTTLSCVLIRGSQLHIAHVGDSRIYLIRNHLICQLTQDHSLVTMLVANGQIGLDEAIDHPDRSVLLRSLGTKPQIFGDYIHSLKNFGQDAHLTLEDQDILILCCDGVWEHLCPEEILNIFDSNNTKVQSSLKIAMEEILQRGAKDNATLIALRIHLSNE